MLKVVYRPDTVADDSLMSRIISGEIPGWNLPVCEGRQSDDKPARYPQWHGRGVSFFCKTDQFITVLDCSHLSP
jgi:hypothetical protein